MLITDKPIYQRVYRLVEHHNQLQKRAADRITKNRYAMLRAVTELYIKEARAAVQHPAWADSDRLPSLYTNRQELAMLVGCSERTVYNCLDLLERAGFVQKVWHGWQTCFELIVHPWIIFGSNYQLPRLARLEDVEKALKNSEKALSGSEAAPLKRQNLPPISSHETRETSKIFTNSGVDFGERWGKACFTAENLQNPRVVVDDRRDRGTDSGGQEREGEKTVPLTVGQLIEKSGGASHHKLHKNTDDGGAESHPGLTNQGSALKPEPTEPTTDQLSAGPGPEVDPKVQDLKRNLTVTFWKMAKEQLWPNDYINPDYERKILNLLWTDVFGSWSGRHSANEVATLYEFRVYQIQQAVNYARRHQWSGFLPPPLYFSYKQYQQEKKTNKRGSFWWTFEWLKDAKHRKSLREKQDVLAKAVRSVITGKAPRGLKDGPKYDQIQLYSYWRKRLAKLADSSLLDAFEEQISTLVTKLR